MMERLFHQIKLCLTGRKWQYIILSFNFVARSLREKDVTELAGNFYAWISKSLMKI